MNPHRLHSPSFLFMITSFMFIIGISSSLSHNDIDDQRLKGCSYQFGCGSIQSLSYPFWAPNHGPDCGLPGFKLECQDNIKPPVIVINSNKYRLLSVDQEKKIMRVVRMDIWEDACPHKLFNTSFDGTPFDYAPNYQNLSFLYKCSPRVFPRGFKGLKCSTHDEGGFYKEDTVPQNVQIQSCKAMVAVPVLLGSHKDRRLGIQEILKKGFELKYKYDDGQACSSCDESNPGKNKSALTLATVIPGVMGILIICLLLFYCNRVALVETPNHRNVEVFLRNCRSISPKRYSYSDVKKMTYSFKDKLGQGGYGGVYKGKLLDGRLVAVKVLNKSKGDGQEFVNEVASISRTSHVNVVTLLGFCFEGSKRALIYEFMPNGSLEKYIYENPSRDHQLGWETLYQIAIGIARGLEYLHRGCNTRILHFDIKPHNILLDEDFCPKISDFGLAKLCPKDESIISMLDARGTAGYIAPEVFCRNIGGVSHKSDVYSYGMMVLEMVGGRKNLNLGVDHTSQIYFPYWIYKRLERGDQLGLHGIMNEEENEKARKMVLVSLWCIQTDPSNRPPMGAVVEMLQGSLGSLQVPPRPFLSSPPRS